MDDVDDSINIYMLACGGRCVVLGAKLLHQLLVVHAAVLVCFSRAAFSVLCTACNGIHLTLLPTGNLCQHICLVAVLCRFLTFVKQQHVNPFVLGGLTLYCMI